MHKQNEKFNKDTETIKNQIEILELKKTLNELKNSNRASTADSTKQN